MKEWEINWKNTVDILKTLLRIHATKVFCLFEISETGLALLCVDELLNFRS